MFRDTNALKQAFVAMWVMARVSASKTKPSRILIYGGRRPVLADPVAFCRPSMVSKAERSPEQTGAPRCSSVTVSQGIGNRTRMSVSDASGHHSAFGTAETTGHVDERALIPPTNLDPRDVWLR
jgi:hypothetical protein